MYHVILACHNRSPKTLESIRGLEAAFREAREPHRVLLYDDGSTDGTSAAVRVTYPGVEIITGPGNSYWAKSMAVAFETIWPRVKVADDVIWLNDDVILDSDAITRILQYRAGSEAAAETCLVGAMRDPQTHVITYSGFRRSGWHPLSFIRVDPADEPQVVDTFNGNFVVIPQTLCARVGAIDGAFSHALADLDYGMRVTASGGRVVLLPGTFGTCARNETSRVGALNAWKAFRGPKGGGNYQSVRRYVRKHEPHKWPLAYFASCAAWWFRRARGIS